MHKTGFQALYFYMVAMLWLATGYMLHAGEKRTTDAVFYPSQHSRAQLVNQHSKDRDPREENLRAVPVNLAGRYLLRLWPEIRQTLTDFYQDSGDIYSVAEIKGSTEGFIELPNFGAFEVSYDGKETAYSPAFIGVRDDQDWYVLIFGIALKLNGKEIMNTNELRSMRDTMAILMPELAAWLPSGITTVLTKIEFDQVKGGKKPTGSSIFHELADRDCHLILTSPFAGNGNDLMQVLVIKVY